jgi:S-adenosylmethionine:tRNA ribosyltransferase-isomerase
VVCGTSALPTLETVVTEDVRVHAGQRFTADHHPGHQPAPSQSSEILLTSAFAGRNPLLAAYHRKLIP